MGRRVLKTMVLMACVLFAGCTTTRVVTIPEYHYRDSVQVRTLVDSVYLHDSVFVSLTASNDTVTIEKYTVKYRDRIKVNTDTIFITRVDTITKEVKVSDKGEEGKAASWLEVLLVMAFITIALYSIKRSVNMKTS